MCRITLHLHTAGIVNVEVNVPLDDMDGKRRTQRAVAKEAIEVKSVAALYEEHGGDSPWHKYALVSGRQSFVAFNEAEWKALKKDDTIYLSGEVHVCVWVCMCECACVCVCVYVCVSLYSCPTLRMPFSSAGDQPDPREKGKKRVDPPRGPARIHQQGYRRSRRRRGGAEVCRYPSGEGRLLREKTDLVGSFDRL